jgi:hypothetical protein
MSATGGSVGPGSGGQGQEHWLMAVFRAQDAQRQANDLFEELTAKQRFFFIFGDRPLTILTLIAGFALGVWQTSSYFLSSAQAAAPAVKVPFLQSERGIVVLIVFASLVLSLLGLFFSRSARVSKAFESISQTLVGGLIGLLIPR